MEYIKLEIFIPETHFPQLQKALQEADAGHIGNYDSCLSYSPVISTWRPLAGTHPYIGEQGTVSCEPELKVEVTIRAENLNEISGTLYGYRFGVGAHYFMGGILIDEDTHVVNTEGNPIEGLYAAGEVTGGFHGTFRVDGSGLGDSFTFGRLAGKKMAEALN